ncbi:MAG: PfaB family protein [Pelolinea sp.]|nr:PfaB family protein [Pelolinea sp.]
MSDLSNCIDLSIIGMEIIGPSFNDLESYGFQLFRGLKSKDSLGHQQLSDDDLKKVITKTIQQAGMNIGNVGVVTLQSGLQERINKSGIVITSKDISDQKGGIASAWIAVSDWLENKAVDAVLLLEENRDNQSFSAVLVCTSKFAFDNGKQILAFISGAAEYAETAKNKSVEALMQSALKSGTLQPDMIGLILVSAPLEIAPEMNSPQELIATFPSNNGLSCALTGGNGGLILVIKAVWCLYQRIIPGTRDWTAPTNLQSWVNSAFYIPTESRTWFTSANQPTRFALTINATQQGTTSAFIFREGQSGAGRKNAALQQEPFFLLPVSGDSLHGLIQNLENLQKEQASKADLRNFYNENLKLWRTGMQPNDLIACILGHSWDELNREIEFAIKGIPAAVEKKTDWRTPLGSYITPKPLGKSGSVTFVYPGAFNSYPGAGRDLVFLFPTLYDRLANISTNLSDLINEKMLYPRSISALSITDLEGAEKRLAADPLAMLISGTSLAALYTFLLRGTFDIHPASAIGYSLGEISMMFASGVWTQADETSASLRASPLFRTRLAGPQNTVRESWKLPIKNQSDADEIIWANYVVMAAPEAVNVVLKSESRVFITHINTPRQVAIAGDPAACRRVIETLKCNSLQAPFNYALHCEAMQSEFNDLQTLLSWPVSNQPGMTLYSAATYQAMPIEQKAIARQIAYGLCHQLDFPRLVHQAYTDGARIFIELGAGSNCSRWVDDSLKDRPHAAFSINRKGLDDHAAILQLLAKLISHHVPVNLSAILS